MLNQLTYKTFGKNAILIEWPAVISEDVLQDIVAYKTKIERLLKLQDVIVGYNSLLLVYNFEIEKFQSKVAFLKELYFQKGIISTIRGIHWSVPVCYDPIFGIDLELVSERKNKSIKEIIRLHTEVVYKVYFIGFLPGFLYLGGLNSKIAIPRKETPRLRVPKGAVAIGGSQTGVYPTESSGGWNIIGNSPVSFFDIDKITPCFAKTGDKISFESISFEAYTSIKEQLENNTYQLKKIE